MNTFGFFWNEKSGLFSIGKAWALEKHGLSNIFSTDLFWKESI